MTFIYTRTGNFAFESINLSYFYLSASEPQMRFENGN